MKFKQEAIQLISVDPVKQKFRVNPTAIQLLRSLTKPLSIISVSGVYRTGKSYLINEMFIRKSNAFKIGATTEALTKGIWIWGTPILDRNSEGQEFYHIIIDSEGIGSTDKQNNYDCKILLLVFLLSSTIIYNTMGVIDELAIDNLRVVLELRKCMKLESNVDKASLVWILRDFSLELVDRDGEQITDNQYLEQSLQDLEYSEINAKKNEIRKTLRSYFNKRSCYTLVRPIVNQLKLQNLSEIDKDKLRPEFVTKVDFIRKQIMNNSIIKTINNQQVNGTMLVKLVHSYVESLNNQKYPDVTCNWNMITESTNRELYENKINKLDDISKRIELPQDCKHLKNRLNNIETSLINEFKGECFRNESYKELCQQLKNRIKRTFTNLKEKNNHLNAEKDLHQIQLYYAKTIRLKLQEPNLENITEIKDNIIMLYEKLKVRTLQFKFYHEKLLQFICITLTRKKLQKQSTASEIQILKHHNENLRASNIKLSNAKNQYQLIEQKLNIKSNRQSELITTVALHQQKIQFLTAELDRYKRNYNEIEDAFQNSRQQSNRKSKQKQEQLNTMVKQLKEQNLKLHIQKQEKEQQLEQSCKKVLIFEDPKQNLFQAKLKECLDKFQVQRKGRDQVELQYKKKILELESSIAEINKKHNQDQEAIYKIKKNYNQKEKFYCDQLQELKKNLIQTKINYEKTTETLLRNNQVLKNIQNMKHTEAERSLAKRQKAQQNEWTEFNMKKLQSQNNSLKNQNKRLQSRNNKLEDLTQQLQDKIKNLSQRLEKTPEYLQAYKQKQKHLYLENQKLKLQKENISQNFQNTLTNIMKSKDKQRLLYEQSIKRLLINIEKKQINKDGRMSEISNRNKKRDHIF